MCESDEENDRVQVPFETNSEEKIKTRMTSFV